MRTMPTPTTLVLMLTAGTSALVLHSSPALSAHAAASATAAAIRTRPPLMLEPVTTIAFAAGLLPPSAILLAKDVELREEQKRNEALTKEIETMKEGFLEVVKALELKADAADEQLAELVASGVYKLRKEREEFEEIKQSYTNQILQLKELLGDYSDKFELQQNSVQRQQSIAESAQRETDAVRARAAVLDERLQAAQSQIATLQKRLNANPIERVLNWFRRD